MKNIFRIGATVLLSCLVTFIGTVAITSAENNDHSLIDKLEQIVDLLTRNIEEKESNSTDEIATMFTGKNVFNPNCFDNYEEWPVSQHKKENVPWDTGNMFSSTASDANTVQQFLDLNSDGLVDYLYFSNNSYNMTDGYNNILVVDGVETNKYLKYKLSCIKLNNGQGWDNTYKCVETYKYIGSSNNGKPSYIPQFYGDCAELSS